MNNLSQAMLRTLSERELANELASHDDELVRRFVAGYLDDDYTKEQCLKESE